MIQKQIKKDLHTYAIFLSNIDVFKDSLIADNLKKDSNSIFDSKKKAKNEIISRRDPRSRAKVDLMKLIYETFRIRKSFKEKIIKKLIILQ